MNIFKTNLIFIKNTAVIFAAVMLFNSFSAYAAVSIEELENNLKKNESEKQKIISRIETAQGELDDALKKKYSLDVEMNTINSDIEMINDAIRQKDDEIKSSNLKIEELNNAVSEGKAHLASRMKIMYEGGGFSYLDILLDADGFGDLFARITVIKDIVRHDRALIDRYIAAKEEIEHSLESIEKEQIEQQAAKAVLDEKKSGLEQLQRERGDIISELKKEINGLEISSDENDRYEKEARNELIRLMEKAAAEEEAKKAAEKEAEQKTQTPSPAENSNSPSSSPTPSSKPSPTPSPSAKPGNTDSAGFGWPSDVSKRITSPYGYRPHPISGDEKLHSGIDIGVGENNNVLASKAGTVVTAGWNNGYGYYVTINHGNGTATLYAHNNSLLVEPGDKVSKGQVIAKSGSTGNSTGPHIHFEIIIDGETVDPADYF
ncbi:MAG: peptidoglycan DD-metalloendopeptidase family protein [Oscillospiraceae bacterium]|nr:peptidoglycan DD-metalloendopeptidase family protein [Oscillospiraceae bacterium]